MVGKTISHYKVLEKIGQGGMGEVFLAQDTTLDRKVALKFLPEELQQDSTAKKRFLREAKSAAALDHPFICHIHEVGEVEGKSFIAMEYIQGTTLREKLTEGPLPVRKALETAGEMAEALEAAHKQKIVHRDLKPSNIMLTPEGHVKVMDFGLAKRVTPVAGQEQEITTALTQQGSTLGTVPYMSPEQVRGQEVDTRSDIFSFGVVLYEMLTGAHPFKGDTSADTSHAILGETPPPLTRYTEDIPVLLQHTVRKMLAKEADDRYQLIHEVRTNLGELLEESGDSISEVAIGLTGVSSAAGWWAASNSMEHCRGGGRGSGQHCFVEVSTARVSSHHQVSHYPSTDRTFSEQRGYRHSDFSRWTEHCLSSRERGWGTAVSASSGSIHLHTRLRHRRCEITVLLTRWEVGGILHF